MDCGHYEVEIGKRTGSAASAEESAALDLHLASCASCRAFEHTVHELEAAMHASTNHEISNVDWNRIEREWTAMVDNYRNSLARMVIAALPLIALITWAADPGERIATVILCSVFTAGILIAGVVVRRRIDAKVSALGTAQADLLAAYRDELDMTIQRLRHGRVYFPVFGALWLAGGVKYLIDGARLVTVALWIGMSILFLVQAVLAHRQLGTRVRERAELG